MKTYWHNWDESGEAGMLGDFGITKADIEGAEILAASYAYEAYSGSAYVLFRKGGKLFSVNGSHCSCYGLEGQWSPEEVVVAADKDFAYSGFGDEFAAHVRGLLSSLAT